MNKTQIKNEVTKLRKHVKKMLIRTDNFEIEYKVGVNETVKTILLMINAFESELTFSTGDSK